MKLLYITNGITGSGGLERVLSVKASELAEKWDYNVHILALNEAADKKPFFKFSPKIKRHQFTVPGSGAGYLSGYASALKKAVEEIKPDVISVCDDGLKAFFVPKILGKKYKIVYERHVSKLITSHGVSGLAKISASLQFALMNLLAKAFSAFVVLTDGNRNEWPDLKNIHVIPNPLPFFPEQSSPLTAKKVIGVGKYSYQKGFDLLLDAWAKLPHGLEDWQLHLYGKQDQLANLSAQAASLNIDKSVFFHGPDRNIEKRFLESSVFALSSRYEGFGMVIIEAMACGLPVVSFDCPYGPSDIISDQKDGFLVANGDTVELAFRLEELMTNDQLRFKMGADAKKNVVKFLPANIAKKWNDLFIQLTQ